MFSRYILPVPWHFQNLVLINTTSYINSLTTSWEKSLLNCPRYMYKKQKTHQYWPWQVTNQVILQGCGAKGNACVNCWTSATPWRNRQENLAWKRYNTVSSWKYAFVCVRVCVHVHVWMNEWMNENLYIAHKKLPHKTLRVHSARYTQWRACPNVFKVYLASPVTFSKVWKTLF